MLLNCSTCRIYVQQAEGIEAKEGRLEWVYPKYTNFTGIIILLHKVFAQNSKVTCWCLDCKNYIPSLTQQLSSPCFVVIHLSSTVTTWTMWNIPSCIVTQHHVICKDDVVIFALPDLISCSAGPIENTDADVSTSLSRDFFGRLGVLSLSSYILCKLCPLYYLVITFFLLWWDFDSSLNMLQ